MLDSEYPKRFKQQDILIGWLEYVWCSQNVAALFSCIVKVIESALEPSWNRNIWAPPI